MLSDDIIAHIPAWDYRWHDNICVLIWCDHANFDVFWYLPYFLKCAQQQKKIVFALPPSHKDIMTQIYGNFTTVSLLDIQADMALPVDITHLCKVSESQIALTYAPALNISGKYQFTLAHQYGIWRDAPITGISVLPENKGKNGFADHAIVHDDVLDAIIRAVSRHSSLYYLDGASVEYGQKWRGHVFHGIDFNPYHSTDYTLGYTSLADIIITADNYFAKLALNFNIPMIIIANDYYDMLMTLDAPNIFVVHAHDKDIVAKIFKKYKEFLHRKKTDYQRRTDGLVAKYTDTEHAERLHIAQTLYDNYDCNAALKICNHINDPIAQNLKISCYERLNDYAAAANILQGMTVNNPKDIVQTIRLAKLWRQAKYFKRAAQAVMTYYDGRIPKAKELPADEIIYVACDLLHLGAFADVLSYCHYLQHKNYDNGAIRVNVMKAYLCAEDFEHGWQALEGYYDHHIFGHLSYYDSKIPVLGRADRHTDYRNVDLLVIGYDGLGDLLVNASMLGYLAVYFKTVTYRCDHRLVALLQRSFPTLTIIADNIPMTTPYGAQMQSDVIPSFLDFRLSFNPVLRPYLKIDDRKQQDYRSQLLSRANGRKIIGVSHYSASLSMQRVTEIALDDWSPIWALDNVLFVNLQYGRTAYDLSRHASSHHADIIHYNHPDPLYDIDGFTALVGAMDAVVTLPNTLVHQAGGLGIPCFVILHQTPAWRFGYDRTTSYWYPHQYYMRQQNTEDTIAPTISRTYTALQNWIADNF